LGHLIPGGTGFPLHRYVKLVPLCEPVSDAVMEELRREAKAKQDSLYQISSTTEGEEGDEEAESADAAPVAELVNDATFDDAPVSDDYASADDVSDSYES
ncbi:MAG: hypothetical protein IJ802_05790, partial [Kiritimatiellae bacterium]|nr:hypothetical protein [Kiritimatiellia bacterium]